MATEAILVDVGMLYKRLFNHRPIIQNEVNYFVKEFETKKDDNDMKTMQDAMSKADEINNVFLNEIMCSGPQFKTIKEKASTIKATCEEILGQETSDLWISQEEQEKLDQQFEEYQSQLKQKQKEVFALNEQEILKLKGEIEEVRECRNKMRSYGSSMSSSITIYPPASPEEVLREVVEEDQEVEEGGGVTGQELGAEKVGGVTGQEVEDDSGQENGKTTLGPETDHQLSDDCNGGT